MKFQVIVLVSLGPLVAYGLPKANKHRGCGAPPSNTTLAVATDTAVADGTSSQAVGYYTGTTTSSQATSLATVLPATGLSTFSAIPMESLSAIFASNSKTAIPSSTVTIASTAAPTTSATAAEVTATSAAASSSNAVSNVASGSYSAATPVSFKIPATEQCGDNDILTLPGMPWVVANSMYNADRMVGSQCTNFEGILEATDGTKEVQWTSVTDIDLVDSTKDLCKGYTNIGIGTNLNKKLSDISSIPAFFKWDRTNTTEFKGSNLFDFITAPTSGDTQSSVTSEFMLWVKVWGGQVPIGYADGPTATFNLYGTSWKLYEGQNPNSGVTVRSMLVDEDFEGEFQGDLKDWLTAMVQKGFISDSDYLTVGNAGTEVFYGSAIMSATVALDIRV